MYSVFFGHKHEAIHIQHMQVRVLGACHERLCFLLRFAEIVDEYAFHIAHDRQGRFNGQCLSLRRESHWDPICAELLHNASAVRRLERLRDIQKHIFDTKQENVLLRCLRVRFLRILRL